MSEPSSRGLQNYSSRASPSPYGRDSSANLADILERVLDKGIVIAGDIQINLLDIELLTIKLRLLIASVDKAKEMGIDWWEHDPALSSSARNDSLAAENRRLRTQIEAMREREGIPTAAEDDDVVPGEVMEVEERVEDVEDESGEAAEGEEGEEGEEAEVVEEAPRSSRGSRSSRDSRGAPRSDQERLPRRQGRARRRSQEPDAP
ncbi:gas vesicle protein [Streptomyces sp. NPDC058001]|uniref:gas vesicle protein n=1 Tax=Streptomyces sp. NPDC058001 TaxID=3346300 RepID=UPI0036F1051F